MERKRYAREFKLEAVRLVRSVGFLSRRHRGTLECMPTYCASGSEPLRRIRSRPSRRGQMKPDQLEVERLRREVRKLKAERDILKKSRGLLR